MPFNKETREYTYLTFKDPNPKIYTKDEMIDFARFVWYNKDLKDTSIGVTDFLMEWEEARNKQRK